jgi:hypothetical protein
MTKSPVKKLKAAAVARQKRSERTMKSSIKATKELERRVIVAKANEARDVREKLDADARAALALYAVASTEESHRNCLVEEVVVKLGGLMIGDQCCLAPIAEVQHELILYGSMTFATIKQKVNIGDNDLDLQNVLARVCACGLMEDDGGQYTSTSDLCEHIRGGEGN